MKWLQGSKSDGEEKAKDKTDTEREDEDKSRSPAASKKRKIRLDMHLDQVFVDAQDAFVWLYDPTPWYYWVAGSAIVLGVIAVCLFPLWPSSLRLGAHYLSLAAAGFLVLIIALGLFKYALFGVLFALSGGKLR
jgi:translocation protein SEC62